MASFLEDFADALSGWTNTYNTIAATGGQGAGGAAYDPNAAVYTGASFGADQYAQLKLVTQSAFIAVGVRCSNEDSNTDGYWLYIAADDTTFIYKNLITSVQTIAGQTWSATDVAKISVSGSGTSTTVKAYKNGVQIGTNYVDSSGAALESGYTGIFIEGTGSRVDDFEAGDGDGTGGGAGAKSTRSFPKGINIGAFRGMGGKGYKR